MMLAPAVAMMLAPAVAMMLPERSRAGQLPSR
jgi:hypothetical protein